MAWLKMFGFKDSNHGSCWLQSKMWSKSWQNTCGLERFNRFRSGRAVCFLSAQVCTNTSKQHRFVRDHFIHFSVCWLMPGQLVSIPICLPLSFNISKPSNRIYLSDNSKPSGSLRGRRALRGKARGFQTRFHSGGITGWHYFNFENPSKQWLHTLHR